MNHHDIENRQCNNRYSQSRWRARNQRGLEWKITRPIYYQLLSKPCHYCRKPISPTGCGLDRLDNSIGYIVGNVVPCCGECNFRKGSLEAAGFTYPRIVEVMFELIATNPKHRCFPSDPEYNPQEPEPMAEPPAPPLYELLNPVEQSTAEINHS